ncbi:hypothetical protein ACFQ7O_33685 [Streptomyces sp. NPDC056485]|uniref:hypothetical protein n=1 Tax=Streptomyces sp. NPDC056485 TaxID=3345834 RepID=UPI00368D904D
MDRRPLRHRAPAEPASGSLHGPQLRPQGLPRRQAWHGVGINELSAITADHVQQTLAPPLGEARKSPLGALRSLFRALKREKLIFRDPIRGISPTTARALPRP